MKRCMTCKYFRPINEIAGVCEVRGVYEWGNYKGCSKWTYYKD